MSNVNFNALPQNTTSPELKQRLENQENYTALNKEQIKNDAVEIGKKVQNNANENFLFRTMRNVFGVEDPKKTLKSIGLSILTVIGLAVLGNKLSTPSARLGEKVDDILLGDNVLAKFYKALGNGVDALKQGISKLPRPKFVNDIIDTMHNRKLNMQFAVFRGYERGPVGIFINTLRETFNYGPLKGRANVISNAENILNPILKNLGENSLDTKNIDSILQIANDALAKATDTNDVAKLNDLINNLTQTKTNIDKPFLDLLTKLSGSGNAEKIFQGITQGVDSSKEQAFYTKLIDSIVENLKNTCPNLANKSKVEILDLASKNKLIDFGGPDVSSLVDVTMMTPKANGIFGKITGTLFHSASDWWPVHVIENIGKKFNPNFKFGRGNLFDSLIKFNAINATGTKTLPAKLIQKIPTLSTESISNFVNDKSGLGVLLGIGLIDTYNNVQDAPKEKKFSTGADDLIGQILNWSVSMPLTYKTVYSLASLKNLQGNGPMSFILRQAGKIFGLGLGAPNTGIVGKMKGIGGGAFRFFLFMFVVSPIISKFTRKVTNKIFGKPYDKNEEAKKAQIEAQKNQIIPELGITQGELAQKIEKNPKAIQELQNNPDLVRKLQQNPKFLVDYLDGKAIPDNTKTAVQKPQMSPLNAKLINERNNNQLFTKKTPQKQNNEEQKSVDTASYIPDSRFTVKNSSSLSEEKLSQYNQSMAQADKILKRAEKYI